MSGAVGAVDIGTNSVRLLITDAAGRERVRQMFITRLGQGVDVTGRLAPEAIERTASVLERYGETLRAHAVERLRVTATSAARDAENRDVFFARARQALGVTPELIDGHQEAALSFAGATAGLDPALGPFLVIDIGGGSTEFVLGRERPSAARSTAMGCVRMTERWLKSDPPTERELAACADDVAAILREVPAAVPVAQARTVIGVAGTVTTLGCLSKGLMRYDPAQTHGMVLTREEVDRLTSRLAGAPLAARRAMLTEPQRAEVIVGGAVVLRQILRDFDIPAIRVSEADILDGLAASLLDAP